MPGDGGLDIDLMTEIAESLRATVEFIAYEDRDFNGIFDALNVGDYDCVAAGTTVTPDREKKAAFAPPYLISGQWLAVDTRRLPHVRSIDDLGGLIIGVQQGNTSEPIAERLVAEGKAAAVRIYDYGTIRSALTDLTTGTCDAFMKLGPVLTGTGQADPQCRGRTAGPLRGEHRHRRSARRSGTSPSHHGRSGRAGAGRNVATDTPEMAGQSVHRSVVGGALNQPARGEYHTTRLALSIEAKKGDASDHPGGR
jgi:hypothetical protein